MKQTFCILKNNSGSEGTYFIDGEYKTIFPGQEITLDKIPVNKTANITTVLYRRTIGEEKVLNKKTRRKN
jgi:hypothetical protein